VDERVFGVRGSLAARRLANPVTLCDGHGVFFVAASGQIQMAADTAVDEFGWRVHRVPAELPSPSSLPASLAELRCDWEAWLADSDIPVGTPFLISPRFEYDVALNAFFSSVEMVAAPRTTQEGYARDVAAFLTFLWTSAPATGRPRDPVHAADQGATR
jgi:hypothetical protein